MSGRAFVFGDKIDTDVLAPGALMKLKPEQLAQHCLEAIAPDFAKSVQPGDVVFGGYSFGIGSSREQAAVSLKILGVKAVLAKSFARIFYRNAFNLGLPALFFPQADEISNGDRVELDLAAGRVTNHTTSKDYSIAPVPAHLRAIIDAGGIVGYLQARQAQMAKGDGV
jgi:3-isopropylmalate/(R)-2-methylmalate dehydratase small subunit